MPEEPTAPRNLVVAVEPASILVVDDDPDIRRIIRIILSSQAHRICEAKDGLEAKEACLARLPDLIVTDLMMPGLDGSEFIQWFRSEFPERFVPILMITARAETEHKVKNLELGADEYLTKPFNHHELLAHVQALLRTKLLTEELYHRNQELEQLNIRMIRLQNELLEKERKMLALQFAGTAAHALGQPLTSILLNCHFLEQQLAAEEGKSPSELLPTLKRIREECQGMVKILEQLKSIDSCESQDYPGNMTIRALKDGAA